VCVCVCVAVSRWVCRSIVRRYVCLVGSGAWGQVPRCMYQSGWGFFYMQVHWVLPGWVIVVFEGRVSIGVGVVQGGREVTVHPENTHLRLNINFKLI